MRPPNEVFENRMRRLLKLHRVPGCSLSCVTEGQLSWTESFGVADEAVGSQVATRTSFQVASLSKIVSAWAALKLVAQGRLDLDQPVDSYVPVLKEAHSDGRATLRALLSHTAGLPSAGSELYARIEDVPTLETAVADSLPTSESVADSEARFQYSNPGYAVVELLIENLTGETFTDWVGREVLAPLGMTRSTFDRQRSFDPDSAGPHLRRGRVLPRTVLAWLAPGGLHSTADDLARLVQAMVGSNAANVLPQDLVDEMSKPPPASIGAFRLRSGGYGLGELAGQLASGKRFVANQGARPGWRSLLMALPDTGDGLVVLTNSNSGLTLTMHVAELWLRKVVGEPLKLHRVVRLTG